MNLHVQAKTHHVLKSDETDCADLSEEDESCDNDED